MIAKEVGRGSGPDQKEGPDKPRPKERRRDGEMEEKLDIATKRGGRGSKLQQNKEILKFEKTIPPQRANIKDRP